MKWCNNRGAGENGDRCWKPQRDGQEIIRRPSPDAPPEIGNIDKIFSLLFTILVERL